MLLFTVSVSVQYYCLHLIVMTIMRVISSKVNVCGWR